MKNIKKILACSLALVMLLLCIGCNKADDANVLTLATSADFPPYEFVDEEGNYAGIDIEVAGLIAEKLGMTLQVENMDFNSIVTSVASGKYDIGMAGLTVSEERLESVNFTDSYAKGVQVIIVKEGSPITTVDDLYATGATYKVGVQLSTTGDIYFSTDIDDGKTTCTVEQFKSGADAVLALNNGQIDCVLIDNEPAKSFVKANAGLKILDTEYANEDYAICLSKENTELLEKVNGALKELIADGKLQEIVDKYIPAESDEAAA